MLCEKTGRYPVLISCALPGLMTLSISLLSQSPVRGAKILTQGASPVKQWPNKSLSSVRGVRNYAFVTDDMSIL